LYQHIKYSMWMSPFSRPGKEIFLLFLAFWRKTLNFKAATEAAEAAVAAAAAVEAAADGIQEREVHICHCVTCLCLTHFKIALRA
jgi:hypothetical protein